MCINILSKADTYTLLEHTRKVLLISHCMSTLILYLNELFWANK